MVAKEQQKVYKDRCKYETTQQTETYRQTLAKEKKILAAKTNADIEKLDPYFNTNNNYLGILKKNPESQSTSINQKHPLDQLGVIDQNYCQKCKKDVGFCLHQNKNDNIYNHQNDLKFPATSSQQYGWRQPIDTMTWGYGIQGTLQTFGSSLRGVEKKQEKKEEKK
ncbi:hypothetical protein IMG5_170000 [Ichthyophthirius multifiliis]|uniref:Uncharacterized protein n=1 Tax=Ichthyophthirius multifiliis TaxID=5932 RepID=G0R1E3_ICHMU|nr:hypothetical protein IMG5_170000 [Ichthyophthirius multifiliis]EGR28700.1 hypothetical protein IMG5_170000 [Ichthyophthirius multifiliis]|eukprot:XP_004029936.1 hypothetical protein IMG5_170000 [Ichthyophthirius multifiliis]